MPPLLYVKKWAELGLNIVIRKGHDSSYVRIGSIRRGPDDASQEDQAGRHRTGRDEKTQPLHAAYHPPSEHATAGDGTVRDSRGVGGVGVLVNTHLAMNIDSYESLTSRIESLRLKRFGSVSALTALIAYAPTSDYDDDDVEAVYIELEKFYKEGHTYMVIVGEFHAKIGPRKSPEEPHIGTYGLEWNEYGERLSEFIRSTKTIHGNSQFQKPLALR
ncbi:unnamed protein product [Heligmosomoides polygyrus]|uniref:Helitron_like_N domain-containing protein n=1 Tax=Heligmosomoides polygyrus TaxID=6339 RepID=A0A183F240_HELPZ|nr:unnamed protein product [Heligmosomoides polygyrus]